MKNGIHFSLSVLSAFLLLGAIDANAQPLKQVGDMAEDFGLTEVISGESIQLHDYSGSIVLLDFFFYW